MPEGYGGLDTEKDVRLGEQDQARRRRGGAAEGLGASRESGRDRQRDRSDLGPVRPQRRRGGSGRGGQGGRGGRPAPRDRSAQQDNVERPRTDEAAKSAEGREQPAIEPQVETTPAPVADAPDTTSVQQTEDATKREKSADAAKAEKPKASKPKAPAKPKAEAKPRAPRTPKKKDSE
jgi:hypothetical protein